MLGFVRLLNIFSRIIVSSVDMSVLRNPARFYIATVRGKPKKEAVQQFGHVAQ